MSEGSRAVIRAARELVRSRRWSMELPPDRPLPARLEKSPWSGRSPRSMPRRPPCAEADPCRRSLTPTEEAALFAGDALRAADRVMSNQPVNKADAAYLAVYAVLAAAALGRGRRLSGGWRGGLGTESIR